MLSKNQIRNIAGLHSKKTRQQEKLFIIEGEKILDEALKSNYDIHTIFALSDWISANRNKVKNPSIQLVEVSPEDLDDISLLSTPNKVLAICHQKINQLNVSSLKNDLCLYLDGISDPGNFGTIIRLAHWFGITQVICSYDTVEFYNPKAVQSTMGSLFYVNLISLNLSEVIAKLKEENIESPVFGAYLDGENVYLQENFTKGILVIGNESHGIQEQNDKFISDKIKIPPSSENHAESLNAAMATAIFLGEFNRKKKYL